MERNVICRMVVLLLLLLFYFNPVFALRPMQWAVEDEGVVFALYGNAILRFDPEHEEWSSIPLPSNLYDKELLELFVHDGILWVAADDVIANADTRYYDWITFPPGGGSPLPGYGGMAFGEDCVWVVGEHGLGKLDSYTEEWTLYPMKGDSLRHVMLAGEEVWACSHDKAIRFDPLFEKTRIYDSTRGMSLGNLEWGARIGDELWYFGAGAIARFDTGTENWRVVTLGDDAPNAVPIQIVSRGELIWLLYPDQFIVYDVEGEAVRIPSWASRLHDQRFLDMTLYQGDIYFASEQMVVVFLPSGSSTELKGDLSYPGEVDGLTRMPLVRILSTGIQLLGVGDGFLAAYLEADDEWKISGLPAGVSASAKTGPYLRIGEQGLELSYPPLPRTTLLGRYTYLAQGLYETEEDSEFSDRRSVRLSSVTGPVSLFFDNTNLQLGDRYGGKYRGASDDLIREVGAGWNRSEPELSELLGKNGYRGGWLWAEGGSRSEKRRRPTFQARGWGGERASAHAEEFFRGGAGLYHLSRRNIVIGTAEVCLDDKPLEEGEYTLDHSSGTFFLSFQDRDLVAEDSVIRITYDYWLEETEDKSVLAIPQLMYNHGDRLSLSFASLYEGIEGQDESLLSGAFRYRSDPDATRRFTLENELIVDSEKALTGGRGYLGYAAKGIDLGFSGISLPEEITTSARTFSEYGLVEEELSFTGRIEPHTTLPITGRASWRTSAGYTGKEGSGQILWTQSHLPALSLELAGRTWDGDTLDTEWEKLELGVDYSGANISWFDQLRFYAKARESREDIGETSTRYRSGLSRVEAKPSGLFDISILAWGRRADDLSSGAMDRISGRGYGRAMLWSSSLLTGLYLYLRGEGSVSTSEFERGKKDVGLERDLLSSAVWRPGRSPLELEATFSRSLTDYLAGVNQEDGFFNYLEHVGGDRDVLMQRTVSVAGGPVIYLPRNSALRIRGSRVEQSSCDSTASSLSGDQTTLRGTLDLLPREQNRWLVEIIRTESETESGSDSEGWSLWSRWERKWSPVVLSRATFSASGTETDSGSSWTWAPGFYLQLGSTAGGVEFRGEISPGRRRSGDAYEWFVRSNARVQVRAHRAFLFRFEARPELRFPDHGDPTAALVLNIKAGADF
jgi:streptogramin lyase